MMQRTERNVKILTIPNLLSLFRICLIPLSVWLYCGKQDFSGAGWVILLSGVTDVADGYIARRFNMVSDLGKVLDPIADKLTQTAMMLCLLTGFPLMIVSILLIVGKELFMSATGFVILRRSREVPGASWHGKVATFLLYAMLLHMFWHEIPPAVSAVSIAAGTVMMGNSFVMYAIRNIGMIRCGDSAKQLQR